MWSVFVAVLKTEFCVLTTLFCSNLSCNAGNMFRFAVCLFVCCFTKLISAFRQQHCSLPCSIAQSWPMSTEYPQHSTEYPRHSTDYPQHSTDYPQHSTPPFFKKRKERHVWSSHFWDVALCRLLIGYRRFGTSYRSRFPTSNGSRRNY